MKSIELLLRDNVSNLGRCGDVVKVASGYARNYLVPRGLAIQATAENKKAMARRRERLDVEEAAKMAEIAATVETLSGVRVTTLQKADENGHLFGSVNAALVSELLHKVGHGVEEKQIRLDHPIKKVGEHLVNVHVHGDMHATVKVMVEAEPGA